LCALWFIANPVSRNPVTSAMFPLLGLCAGRLFVLLHAFFLRGAVLSMRGRSSSCICSSSCCWIWKEENGADQLFLRLLWRGPWPSDSHDPAGSPAGVWPSADGWFRRRAWPLLFPISRAFELVYLLLVAMIGHPPQQKRTP